MKSSLLAHFWAMTIWWIWSCPGRWCRRWRSQFQWSRRQLRMSQPVNLLRKRRVKYTWCTVNIDCERGYILYTISIYLSVCLFVCLSVCLSISLSLFLSFSMQCKRYTYARMLQVHVGRFRICTSTSPVLCPRKWCTSPRWWSRFAPCTSPWNRSWRSLCPWRRTGRWADVDKTYQLQDASRA